MKLALGLLTAAAVATTALTVPAHAARPDLKITKISTTKLDDGTCALTVAFKDRTPGSLDGNDSYQLTIKPAVGWDGQWYADHFLVYPCDAFEKGKKHSFVVAEWDDNGNRQKVVSTSRAFTWRR